MPDIVGIRFKKAGKVYYFDPSGVDFKIQDYVVVQTARGVELGQVMIAPKQVLASEITAELKPIVRKANDEDIKRAQDFAAKEKGAMEECTKMVGKLNLPMKLVAAEYNLDGGRLTFYFTAEERVDFRELVRELTAFFKTRIELRQIGPRDQAKIVGGLGRCGRSLCCGSFLTEFSPVSIKMAKEQDLPLDPMKISGVCGRLQCCLAYESAQYHEAKALLPRRGLQVKTPDGVGIVIGGNPLKETVQVEFESKATAEFALNLISIVTAPAGQPATETDPSQTQKAEPVTAETELAQPAVIPAEPADTNPAPVSPAAEMEPKQSAANPPEEEDLVQPPVNTNAAAVPAPIPDNVVHTEKPASTDQAASSSVDTEPGVSAPVQPAEQEKEPPQ
jgi:cell fate regulator YaaT (PSP1 superfamily)